MIQIQNLVNNYFQKNAFHSLFDRQTSLSETHEYQKHYKYHHKQSHLVVKKIHKRQQHVAYLLHIGIKTSIDKTYYSLSILSIASQIDDTRCVASFCTISGES